VHDLQGRRREEARAADAKPLAALPNARASRRLLPRKRSRTATRPASDDEEPDDDETERRRRSGQGGAHLAVEAAPRSADEESARDDDEPEDEHEPRRTTRRRRRRSRGSPSTGAARAEPLARRAPERDESESEEEERRRTTSPRRRRRGPALALARRASRPRSRSPGSPSPSAPSGSSARVRAVSARSAGGARPEARVRALQRLKRAGSRRVREEAPPEARGWFDEPLPEAAPRGRERPLYVWDAGHGVEIDMVHVPEGEFAMGSDDDQDNERPRHSHPMKHGYWSAIPRRRGASSAPSAKATGRALPKAPPWAGRTTTRSST